LNQPPIAAVSLFVKGNSMFANMILFPVYQFVEPLIVLGLAIAVLAIEGAVLWLFNREATSSAVAVAVVVVNVVSFAFGAALSSWLPGAYLADLVDFALEARYGYPRSTAWPLPVTFAIAALLTIAVEIGTFRLFLRSDSLQRYVFPLVLGNALSCVFIFISLAVLLAR
jgi:hypothetical protein